MSRKPMSTISGRKPIHKATSRVGVEDWLELIRTDFGSLQTENVSLQQQIQQLREKNAELEQSAQSSKDLSYHLNLEWHKETEITSRLAGLIADLLPSLPESLQMAVADRVERARHVSVQDIESRLRMPSLEDGASVQPSDEAGPADDVPRAPVTSLQHVPRTTRHLLAIQCPEVVSAVTLSADAQRVFTGQNGCVLLWSVAKHDQALAHLQLGAGGQVHFQRLTPDGTTFVCSGSKSGTITMFDVSSPEPIAKRAILGSFSDCTAIAVSRDYVVGCSSDGSVILYCIDTGKQLRHFIGHEGAAYCAEISGDGTKLLTGGEDRNLIIWDLSSGRCIARYTFSSTVRSIAANPNSGFVCVGTEDEKIEVINLAEPTNKYQLAVHKGPVTSLKYSQSGTWFLSTSRDSHVVAWRSPLGGSIFQAKEPEPVLCCDISHDDAYFVTGSSLNIACLYKLQYHQ